MDTNMSTMTFAEMTAKVATLTHRELVELMGVIVNQLRLEDNTSKDKLGSEVLLGTIRNDAAHEECEKDEKYWSEIAKKYQGCMKELCDGIDPVEYQRRLREDRDIG